MDQWFQDVVKVGGSFIAGWFSHVFVVRRELAARRRAFRAHLASVHAELQSTPDEQFFARHESSIPKVRDECARIREDIKRARLADFTRAADAYCTLRRQDLERHDIGNFPDGDEIKFLFPDDYAQARRILSELLDQMTRYAR